MTSEDGAKPKDGTKPGPDGARGEPVKWQIAVIAAAVFAVIALILLRSSFALRLRALGIGGHDHSLLRADRPLIWSEHRLRAGLAAMRGLDSEDLNDVRVLLNVVRLTGLSDDAGASYGLESKHISPYGASVAGMPGDVAAMFLLLGKAAVHHVVVVGNGQGALGGLLSSYMKTRGTLGSVVVADPSPDVWNGAPAVRLLAPGTDFRYNVAAADVLAPKVASGFGALFTSQQQPQQGPAVPDAIVLDGTLPFDFLNEAYQTATVAHVQWIVVHRCWRSAASAGGFELWQRMKSDAARSEGTMKVQAQQPPKGAVPPPYGVCIARFPPQTPEARARLQEQQQQRAREHAEGDDRRLLSAVPPAQSAATATTVVHDANVDQQDDLGVDAGRILVEAAAAALADEDGGSAITAHSAAGSSVSSGSTTRGRALADDASSQPATWSQYRLRAALASIRGMTPQELRDINVLIHAVRAVGLNYDRRGIYGEDERFMLGKEDGTGLWQVPLEFTSLLVLMSRFELSTVYDIGPLYGYTTCLQAEYLRRFNPDLHVTAIDFFTHWTDHEQAEARLPLTYDAPATTANYTENPPDAVFIDGDHNYTSARSDYLNVGKRAKLAAFHDCNDYFIYRNDTSLIGGVQRYWLELREEYAHDDSVTMLEFVYQADQEAYFGICVIIRHDNAPEFDPASLIVPPQTVESDGRTFPPVPVTPPWKPRMLKP